MATEKISKTLIEREAKEVEMLKIIEALTDAGIKIERVNDSGTLAFMVSEGAIEGRFITIKVVLTKEFDVEAGTGFDIDEAINEREFKLKALADKAKTKASKVKVSKIKKETV